MTLLLGELLDAPESGSASEQADYYQLKKSRAQRGGSRQKRTTVVADFETTTVDNDCRVWGWGLCSLGSDWSSLALDSVQVGTTLDDFIEEISVENHACYFHNLKFDGRFILDWLLKCGYEHITAGSLLPGTFKTVISAMGRFYSISVRWLNGMSTEFRDSYNKLPMTVARIADAFKMTDQIGLSKGEIDYTAERPVGYKITANEADYIRRDVLIVARALGQQLHNGLDRLTVGSDALSEFKRMTGRKQFETLFPTLDIVVDTDIRRAYRGGFTYADPRYSGRHLGNITGKHDAQAYGMVFDVNSLYPSVMAFKPIPYGEPEFHRGKVEPTASHPLTIQALTFTATIKPDHIPCIQIKGSGMFSETEYLSEIPEPTSLAVTNVDLQLMRDHYDVQVLSWDGGWRFKAANGIFDNYIDKWMRIKAHSTGGMRELAKLQLNSLYGKFSSNPDVTGKIPYLDEHDTIRLRRGNYEIRDPVYTAAGVFITSYARDITIRAAQSQYNAFAYADTDSLHLLRSVVPESLSVHPSELGAWKHEYSFTESYYVRAKAYFERKTDGEWHNAIAGVPLHISKALTIADLRPGTVVHVAHGVVTRAHDPESRTVRLHGKLTPRAVPGGIVLQDTPFDLRL